MALILVPILGCVGLTGLLWGGSNLPETSRNMFGSVLVADLARATLYGLALLLPSSLAIARLRDERFRLWRGIALALALCGGHALLAGNVLTLDRALTWPGLPDATQPLVTLLYAGAAVLIGRRWFLSNIPIRRMVLGLGLGGLVSAGWAGTGALGTLPELLLALLEALAISLMSAIFMATVFFYDQETLTRSPIRSGLLAGAVCAALSPSLFAVRGWSAQGSGLAFATVFYSLAAGALLVLDPLARPQPRRAWWVGGIGILLCGAVAIPGLHQRFRIRLRPICAGQAPVNPTMSTALESWMPLEAVHMALERP